MAHNNPTYLTIPWFLRRNPLEAKQEIEQSLILLADKWRSENGYKDKGGVIVIYHDEIQGWVNELRNPEHWRPGCVAVTQEGIIYNASGGNIDDGATHWKSSHLV